MCFYSFSGRSMDDVLFEGLHLIDIDLTRDCCELFFAHAVFQVLEIQVIQVIRSETIVR